jgi:PAS domain S-box-containing protein
MGVIQAISAFEYDRLVSRIGKRVSEHPALERARDDAKRVAPIDSLDRGSNRIISTDRPRKMRPHRSGLAQDVLSLRRCLNDLVSVLALPAMWNGRRPAEIVTDSVDSLMGMLSLDFCYALAITGPESEPIEVCKIQSPGATVSRRNCIARILEDWREEEQRGWNTPIGYPFDGGEISVFAIQMGLHGNPGFLVAGSQRADFPEQTETLILSVAANQAAVGLQRARLLSEQRRVAIELDQRVAERTKELAETNEKLQLQVGLLQHLPVSAWTLQPDGTPDFVNSVWLNFSAQSLDFVRSHPEAWMTAVHPDDREAASRAFREGVRSGKGFSFETRSLCAQDGTYRWHLQQAVALRDPDGKVLKFVGTTTDIDEQKRAEEALSRTRAALAHVNRATSLGVLTASITHEVNQPLSGILTNAGTCLRMLNCDPPNIDGARETARRSVRDANRASEVITRLRALFRRKEAAEDWVDLNEAAREVIAMSLSELQAHGVTLKDELADALPAIKGDRIQLQQVILNLIRNAAEAMNSVAGRPRDLAIKTLLNDDNQVCLTVRDSGVGIDPAAVDQLFESFYTTKDEGMGIGLAVSRSIIEAHQGRLVARNNDGPGATFSFSLPQQRRGYRATQQP